MASSATTSAPVRVAPEARFGIAQQIAAFVEVLLLGVWLGSMMFFSFAVAPSAFAVLPTREMAGMLVTSTIARVEVLGLLIGLVLILIQAATWNSRPATKRIRILQLLLVVVMTAAAALSRFWISPTLVSLRAAMGGHIDDVPVTDPMRIQFNDLHQYSVGLMSAAMISGLVVLFFTVRSWLKR
ncbi:MAG: DUF4149 domain-containing protein [Acidobacteriota bacterium]